RGVGALRRLLAVRVPSTGRGHGVRATRTLGALDRCRHLVHLHRPEAAVVLTADHVLRLDVGRLLAAHRRLGADVSLCTVLVPPADGAPGTLVEVVGDAHVSGGLTAPRPDRLAAVWTGDLVVSAGALEMVHQVVGRHAADGDRALLDALCATVGVRAHDVDGFWHHPHSVEAYYEAQMNLCTLRPVCDLYDTGWPVRPASGVLGPAKVVADPAGRAGQALNSLVSDGVVVRGGVVVNTVLGHGVVVESGAEIEDSVLLDGSRVGRGARVRRAVVGVGAVVGDAGEIGFGRPPASPARVLASGLTLVPPIVERPLAAAAGAR
ncbi:MAG TPA: hypothetical protein VKA21_12960, partial [Candidatus Binatia bacterium]|nr:hypothetical protein [Candidatus Binatia bacterium]